MCENNYQDEELVALLKAGHRRASRFARCAECRALALDVSLYHVERENSQHGLQGVILCARCAWANGCPGCGERVGVCTPVRFEDHAFDPELDPEMLPTEWRGWDVCLDCLMTDPRYGITPEERVERAAVAYRDGQLGGLPAVLDPRVAGAL